MTFYSAHSHRGKIQILASYLASHQAVSHAVTSVQDQATAGSLVGALNRIIDAAKAPLIAASEWMDSDFPYPDSHLEALIDRARRTDLLATGHSLWYVYATAELYYSLADLDSALRSVPSPIRAAVLGEVHTIGCDLKLPFGEQHRDPFGPRSPMPYRSMLCARDRNAFRNAMGGHGGLPLSEIAAVLRLLVAGMRLSTNQHVTIDIEFWLISVEHGSDDHCIAQVAGALFSDDHWTVEISRWAIGDNGEPDLERVLDCELPATPTLAEIVNFLDLAANPSAIDAWAGTAQGHHLAGTRFLVTKRH